MGSLTVVIFLPPFSLPPLLLPIPPLLPSPSLCRQPSKAGTIRLPKPRSYTSRYYNIMYKSILPMVSYCRDVSLTVNCFNVCWSVLKRCWRPMPRPPRGQRSKTDCSIIASTVVIIASTVVINASTVVYIFIIIFLSQNVTNGFPVINYDNCFGTRTSD